MALNMIHIVYMIYIVYLCAQLNGSAKGPEVSQQNLDF